MCLDDCRRVPDGFVSPVLFIQKFTRLAILGNTGATAAHCLLRAGWAHMYSDSFGLADCFYPAVTGVVCCAIHIAGGIYVGHLIELDNLRALQERAPR